MKTTLLLILLVSVNTFASSLKDLINSSQTNPSIKALKHEVKVYENLHKAAKSYNYPSLDLSYDAMYLKDKPVVYLPASFGGGAMQMQAQDTYKGSLTLSYPLFSGFAISAQIDEAKLKKHRSLLKLKDLKRNLYLNIVQTYSAALSMKHIISSQQIALKATQDSYKKAKGFFDAGMSSSSELYRIEAMLHSVQSELIGTQNRYKILQEQLSFLSNTPIDDLEELPSIKTLDLAQVKTQALQKRVDIQSAKLMVQEAQAKIQLAKSSYYPSVVLFAQAAYSGDTTALNGDGYTNKNKSVAGFKINYNLFSGLKDHSQVQAAKEVKLSSELMLKSYTDQVSTEISSSFLTYQSLLSQLDAAQAQLKAQEAYEKLVQEKFENQLDDADMLSRAIASSAMARASLIQIKMQLYNAYAKLLLEIDNETFLASLQQ